MSDEQKATNERYLMTRSCKIKQFYLTRAEAKRAARLSTKKFRNGRISAYKCEYCRGFHTGHDRRTGSGYDSLINHPKASPA